MLVYSQNFAHLEYAPLGNANVLKITALANANIITLHENGTADFA